MRRSELYASCSLFGILGQNINVIDHNSLQDGEIYIDGVNVKDNLELMGFDVNTSDELDAKKLAGLCAATVLCGELSLLAAQTNQGELMDAHKRIERS